MQKKDTMRSGKQDSKAKGRSAAHGKVSFSPAVTSKHDLISQHNYWHLRVLCHSQIYLLNRWFASYRD